jgi:hypothetical protein
MAGLPTGTVPFLFTDLEGSPRRFEAELQAYRAALARHNAIVLQVIAAHDGSQHHLARSETATADVMAAQPRLRRDNYLTVLPLRVSLQQRA